MTNTDKNDFNATIGNTMLSAVKITDYGTKIFDYTRTIRTN